MIFNWKVPTRSARLFRAALFIITMNVKLQNVNYSWDIALMMISYRREHNRWPHYIQIIDFEIDQSELAVRGDRIE